MHVPTCRTARAACRQQTHDSARPNAVQVDHANGSANAHNASSRDSSQADDADEASAGEEAPAWTSTQVAALQVCCFMLLGMHD